MAARAPEAQACGCFGRPNPAVPIVQAGERILFAMEDGVVTAHVQIQYAGAAEEFAWLVPLPSEPTVGLGTDEMFFWLTTSTQPTYILDSEVLGICGPPGSENPTGSLPGNPDNYDPWSPVLVSRDVVGPYEYAVLRADEKQPLLDWLNQEGFFVPTGTDDVMDPYIREGAFFLAMKLRSGQPVGALQPVVLQYQSELPMIPLVLTSVAADPDMPVQVWMLGESRAIPRNYFHTEINDAQIDWFNFGVNYAEVVTAAVDEADGHHAFVTEFAGSSEIMRGLMDPPGRFGHLDELAGLTDPVAFMSYLVTNAYPIYPPSVAIIEPHLPVPPEIAARNIPAQQYYASFAYFFGEYQAEFPEQAATIYADFDPAALAAELEERVVVPTRAAAQLFHDHGHLTRLFTTLSPEEMTKDPVFSFNPDLPDVSNIHRAQLIIECSEEYDYPSDAPARLITEQGWVLRMPDGYGTYDEWLDVAMPASQRIEVLREEGTPELIADNAGSIGDAIRDYRDPDAPTPTPGGGGNTSGGCTVGAGTHGSGLAGMGLLGMVVVALMRRTTLSSARPRRSRAILPRP